MVKPTVSPTELDAPPPERFQRVEVGYSPEEVETELARYEAVIARLRDELGRTTGAKQSEEVLAAAKSQAAQIVAIAEQQAGQVRRSVNVQIHESLQEHQTEIEDRHLATEAKIQEMLSAAKASTEALATSAQSEAEAVLATAKTKADAMIAAADASAAEQIRLGETEAAKIVADSQVTAARLLAETHKQRSRLLEEAKESLAESQAASQAAHEKAKETSNAAVVSVAEAGQYAAKLRQEAEAAGEQTRLQRLRDTEEQIARAHEQAKAIAAAKAQKLEDQLEQLRVDVGQLTRERQLLLGQLETVRKLIRKESEGA